MKNRSIFPKFLIILLFNFSCKENIRTGVDKTKIITELKVKSDSLYKIKDYTHAKLYLDSLIKLDTISASYYFKRAYCKTMSRNFNPEDILADYRKALQYGYKNKNSVYLNMGFIFLLTDQFDSALIYTDKCLLLDPNNKKALLNKKEIEAILNREI
jgi:tetratricopeptide (TPR) repeat protein